jgi:serine/threonine protein kinase
LLPLTTLFRIVEDERPPLPSNLSMDLLDFLCQCFQKDPSLRPSAGALGRHIWIKRNFTSRVRSFSATFIIWLVRFDD